MLFGKLFDRRELVDPGIVDQHVEPAELRHRGLDPGLRLRGLGDVALDRDRPAAGGGDRRDDGVRPALARRVVDHDRRAVLRQRLGDRGADALRSTGDDGDFALELGHVC